MLSRVGDGEESIYLCPRNMAEQRKSMKNPLDVADNEAHSNMLGWSYVRHTHTHTREPTTRKSLCKIEMKWMAGLQANNDEFVMLLWKVQ